MRESCVSLTRARKYRTISRTLLPFAGLYVAGFAIGTAIYRATGHLGLFFGPLGPFRRASLSGAPRHPMPTFDRWTEWIPLILCGWLFMAEMARQQNRRSGADRLLLLGYLLLGVSMSRTLVLNGLSETVYLGIATLTGLVLAKARWRAWGTPVRLAAVAVVSAAIVLAVIVWGALDADRLRRM